VSSEISELALMKLKTLEILSLNLEPGNKISIEFLVYDKNSDYGTEEIIQFYQIVKNRLELEALRWFGSVVSFHAEQHANYPCEEASAARERSGPATEVRIKLSNGSRIEVVAREFSHNVKTILRRPPRGK